MYTHGIDIVLTHIYMDLCVYKIIDIRIHTCTRILYTILYTNMHAHVTCKLYGCKCVFKIGCIHKCVQNTYTRVYFHQYTFTNIISNIIS